MTVINDPPFFKNGPLPKYSMKLNEVLTIKMPETGDLENNTPITISFKEVINGVLSSTLNSFTFFQSPDTLVLTPTLFTDLGKKKYEVTLDDGDATHSEFLYVDIMNTPPYFIDSVPTDQSVKFNNSVYYRLPDYRDDEGHNVYVKVFPLYARTFIEVSEDNQFLLIYVKEWKY